MRLSTDQIQAIRQAATAAFGQGTSVWLFGSRVASSLAGTNASHRLWPFTVASNPFSLDDPIQ